MSYRSVVTTDTPASWWHLDETVGPTFTDAVAARNATVTGTPTFGVTGLTADTNKAATFSTAGTIQYGQAANNAAFRPTSFSIEVMVRSRAVTGNNRIVEFGNDACWALYINAGVLSFTVFGHASATYTWLGDADRHHIVGTYDGVAGTAKLYVDGVLVGSQTSTSGTPGATADPLRIGGKPTGTAVTDGWEGTLSEVAFYSSILTLTQVGTHATAAALDAKTLSFAGYTWTKATRGAAGSFVNTFSASQATVDSSGLHVRVDPMGGGYSTGAELALPSSLGYGVYTCVVTGNVSTMHSNVVWGGMFTFGGDLAYGNREIDACEQSKWSGSTATLSHSVWMPSSATDIYAPRGGFNAANNMTTQTSGSHTAVLVWSPGRVTMRLYTGTTVTPANLFRESVVYTGEPVTFNIESGGTYTGAATCPAPFDETLHFNLWVCPNFGGGGDPTTVTAQELVVNSFSFVPLTATLGAGPLRINVDWNRSGSFTDDPRDDVTSRVREGISCSFGREAITSLSPAIAGRGQFSLDNQSRDYSPRYTASPLYGKVKPARPVIIQRDVNLGGVTTTYTIFRGHTDDAPVSPDLDSRTVNLNLVDYLQDFESNTISTTLYQGIHSGAAVNAVLDAAGWTGGRDIDSGSSIFPFWWAEKESALSALQKILASEGPPSLLTVGVAGEIIFRDRNHRLVRTASTTSQATFRGSGTTEPVMGRNFTYTDAWQNIVNDVLFSIDERRLGQNTIVIWQTDDTVTVPASSTTTVLVETSDPFSGAITPVSGTDFTVATGSITSVSLSKTSGAATTITYTAGGGGASLTDVQLRGLSAPVARTWQITATDSTSQADYGQRNVPSGMEPIWCTRYDGQDIAAQFIAQRKDPLPLVTVQFVCQHTRVGRLSKILSLDLSDRVTVTEPETGLSAVAFFVESIAHDIPDLATHVITLGLEMVPSTPTSVFILNTSTLNGTDQLGY